MLGEIASFWPGIPFLAYGLWLAWSCISFSGTAWLSDVERDSVALTRLFVISNLAYSMICFIAVFLPSKLKMAIDSTAVSVVAGLVASLGCVLIVIVGPYYLWPILGETLILVIFTLGAVFAGGGGAVLALRMGIMYGSIPPRRALLYTALSQFVAAFVFFLVVAMPTWSPIPGAPSYVGMFTFTLLPLLTACALIMPSQLVQTHMMSDIYAKDIRALPRELIQLIALTVILAFAASMVRASVTHGMAPTDVLMDNNVIMAMRIPMALVLIVVAFYMAVRDLNFGRLYSIIAIIVVLAMIFASVFNGFMGPLSIVIYAAFNLFDIALWCLFALVVYQKHISPVIVFGLGRGSYGLGVSVGWMFGAYAMPREAPYGDAQSILIVVAAVVLVASVMLFNDRMYAHMLSPEGEDELSLQDMASIPIAATTLNDHKHEDDVVRSFGQAVSAIAGEFGLSPRECEVFRFLAMGRGSDYIAGELQVSWNTVRSHTRNIYVKLDVHSREELLDLIEKYKEQAG